MTIYSLSIYPSKHKQRIRTLFEARICDVGDTTHTLGLVLVDNNVIIFDVGDTIHTLGLVTE